MVLSIGFSLAVFGNQVSASSAAGCALTLAGVAWYNRAPPYSAPAAPAAEDEAEVQELMPSAAPAETARLVVGGSPRCRSPVSNPA